MPTKIEYPYYPIIYIRGFAASMGEIEDTVATPFMGFNLGATKVRQKADGQPHRFIFESPLVRLMKDHDYRDAYYDGDFPVAGQKVPAKLVWIFRYYEPVSESFGDEVRRDIMEFATSLRKFILRVRDHVCESPEDLANFKVNLVAHSMGGLIARCYLQNVCWNGNVEGDDGGDLVVLELEEGEHSDSLVHKVFTYGTPHNGIEMKGINVPDLGRFSPFQARVFNRDVMRKYLHINDKRPANSLEGRFDADHFFCFVGTNYKDYDAFGGLSKRGTGASSDGLVMCKNAYVLGAPRAFAYRSHSGPYGIVNSEEGYQNLRRFLFGTHKVDVLLSVDEISLPPKIQTLKNSRKKIRGSYHFESAASVRGGNTFLHERRSNQESALFRSYAKLIEDKDRRPFYLFSGHLDMRLSKSGDLEVGKAPSIAFIVEIGIKVPLFEVDNAFWFDDHYEGGDIYRDRIIFEITPSEEGIQVKYGCESIHGAGHAPEVLEVVGAERMGEIDLELSIGFLGASALPPSRMRGKLQLKVQDIQSITSVPAEELVAAVSDTNSNESIQDD